MHHFAILTAARLTLIGVSIGAIAGFESLATQALKGPFGQLSPNSVNHRYSTPAKVAFLAAKYD